MKSWNTSFDWKRNLVDTLLYISGKQTMMFKYNSLTNIYNFSAHSSASLLQEPYPSDGRNIPLF